MVDDLSGRAGRPRGVGRVARGLSAARRCVVAGEPAAARAALHSDPGVPARRPQPLPLVRAPGQLSRAVRGGEGPVPALSAARSVRARVRPDWLSFGVLAALAVVFFARARFPPDYRRDRGAGRGGRRRRAARAGLRLRPQLRPARRLYCLVLGQTALFTTGVLAAMLLADRRSQVAATVAATCVFVLTMKPPLAVVAAAALLAAGCWWSLVAATAGVLLVLAAAVGWWGAELIGCSARASCPG